MLKHFEMPIVKATSGGLDAVISTPRTDRDGEIVLPRGLRNRDEYLANPLVFWAHEWAVNPSAEPVAKATRLDISDDRIESSAEYAPTPKAQNVRALVAGGFVRRTSIGAGDIAVEDRDGIPTWTAWSLREWSIVPMPANIDATITAGKSLRWLADQIDPKSGDPEELAELVDDALSSDSTTDIHVTGAGVAVIRNRRYVAHIVRKPRYVLTSCLGR